MLGMVKQAGFAPHDVLQRRHVALALLPPGPPLLCAGALLRCGAVAALTLQLVQRLIEFRHPIARVVHLVLPCGVAQLLQRRLGIAMRAIQVRLLVAGRVAPPLLCQRLQILLQRALDRLAAALDLTGIGFPVRIGRTQCLTQIAPRLCQ